jgi:hypothetical protein
MLHIGLARHVVPAVLAVLVPVAAPAQSVAPAAATCSLQWVGHESAIESFLASGKVTRMEAVPIGVTKPQRAYLEPGPVARFAWKQLPPQRRSGYRESYKAEIAAYQLDRLLDMHMVPPVVERKVDAQIGAAVLWIEETKGWDMKKPVKGPEPEWSRQISRMKLFDLLIGNIDRNQGNVDKQLWSRIDALTPEQLQTTLGAWLSADEQKAMLTRRDRMRQTIEKMVKDKGAAAVFLE